MLSEKIEQSFFIRNNIELPRVAIKMAKNEAQLFDHLKFKCKENKLKVDPLVEERKEKKRMKGRMKERMNERLKEKMKKRIKERKNERKKERKKK